MPQIELIYFSACPLILKAKSVLRGAGIENFLELTQENLEKSDPRKEYSSPSLVIDGKLVIGKPKSAYQCTHIGWDGAEEFLKSYLK